MKLSKKIDACELSPIRKFYPDIVAAERRGIRIHGLNAARQIIRHRAQQAFLGLEVIQHSHWVAAHSLPQFT